MSSDQLISLTKETSRSRSWCFKSLRKTRISKN